MLVGGSHTAIFINATFKPCRHEHIIDVSTKQMASHQFLIIHSEQRPSGCALIKLGCDTWREIMALRILEMSRLVRKFMVPFSGVEVMLSYSKAVELERSFTKHTSCWFGKNALGLLEHKVEKLHQPSRHALIGISTKPADMLLASRVSLASAWIADTLTSNNDRSFTTGKNVFFDKTDALTLLDLAKWKFGSVRGELEKHIRKFHGNESICDEEVAYPILLTIKSIIDEICGPKLNCEYESQRMSSILASDPFFYSLHQLKKDYINTILMASMQDHSNRGYNSTVISCYSAPDCDIISLFAKDAAQKMHDIQNDAHELFLRCKALDGQRAHGGWTQILLKNQTMHDKLSWLTRMYKKLG